jgi:hypothetical protein
MTSLSRGSTITTPGTLKLPENPKIPDEIYEMVLSPNPLQASAPINIPPKNNPLKQSSVFANLAKGVCQQDGSSSNHRQKY